MTKFKYLEMVDREDTNTLIPAQILRIHVSNDTEAEELFAQYKPKFKSNYKGKVIDGEHFKDSKKNKPCKSREIIKNTNKIKGE